MKYDIEKIRSVMESVEEYLSYVKETPAEGLQLQQLGEYKKNGKADKAVRKVDVLNQQLKHGKISKDEFDKKTKEIIDKDGTESNYGFKRTWLTSKGSKKITDQMSARPNKEKSKMGEKDFFTHVGKSYFDAKNIDPITKEKIDRHIAFMRTTDDENEYKQHRVALLKLMGVKDKNVLKNTVISPEKSGRNEFRGNLHGHDGKEKPIPKEDQEKDFIHTSPANGITKLNPTMRSRDNAFFPEKSVYFSKGKPMAHNGFSSDDNGLHQYKYVGNKRKNAIVDQELHGDAVAIKTKYGLPVDQIK